MITTNIETGRKFNRDILDDSWEDAARDECDNNGYSSSENTLNGMAAEQYLIQFRNHTNDRRQYKDTIFAGNSIEVKTASGHTDDYYFAQQNKVLEELRHKKINCPWMNISNCVVYFKRNERKYECESQWLWSGSSWIPNE